jgi:hypothetical protein
VYDNELKALEKEFILRADNNDKIGLFEFPK